MLDFFGIATSLLAEVRPDSELALQLPLDEFGSSQRYCLLRRCRRVIELRSFTGFVGVKHIFISLSIKFVNSFSVDEYSGFCFKAFSAGVFVLGFVFFGLSVGLTPFGLISHSPFSSILLILNRSLPHCFSALKFEKRFEDRRPSFVPLLLSKSFDLLRGIGCVVFSSAFDEQPITALCLLCKNEKYNYFGTNKNH